MVNIKYKHKQILYLVIFLIIIFVGSKTYSTIKSALVHQHISINNVQSITINGTKITNSEEIHNIIKWFNSINNINENPDFSGTTDSSNMEIILNTNEKIEILYPGRVTQDFEIQRKSRKGKWISYWGNQSNIKKILEDAASDKGKIEAISKVMSAKGYNNYPDKPGKVKGALYMGGKGPGRQIPGELQTMVKLELDGTYIVTFTEYWDSKDFKYEGSKDGTQSHFATFEVKGDKVKYIKDGGNFPPDLVK